MFFDAQLLEPTPDEEQQGRHLRVVLKRDRVFFVFPC